MLYGDLQSFIDVLDKKGLLLRVKTEVSQDLEIAEFADKAVKSGGPALLFENVSGYQIPVLINALGSYKRMNLALGVNSFKEIGNHI